MKPFIWLLRFGRLTSGGLLCAALMLAGCEGSDDSHAGDGHDFGPNNPNLLVALGDSITAGAGLSSPNYSYPAKLAGMLNKTVINAGYPGDATGTILDACYSILDDYKPGYVLILAGINDLIMGYGEEGAAINIRIMVQACQDNKTIPVVATLTPVFGEHIIWKSGVDRLNELIRQLCADLGVALVDLNGAFDNNEAYMLSDGLHPNENGHSVMASTFYDAVK